MHNVIADPASFAVVLTQFVMSWIWRSPRKSVNFVTMGGGVDLKLEPQAPDEKVGIDLIWLGLKWSTKVWRGEDFLGEAAKKRWHVDCSFRGEAGGAREDVRGCLEDLGRAGQRRKEMGHKHGGARQG